MRLPITIVLAAGLVACGPTSVPVERNEAGAIPRPAPATATPTPTATSRAQTSSPLVAIDGEGLRLVDPDSGRTRPIPFGTARHALLALLVDRGTPDVGTNTECGAGPLAWARYGDGLQVQFQDDRFVGWSVDRGGKTITTMAGIGRGSTRADLESAYAITLPDSTLGIEFAAGDMGGLLGGPGQNAKITDLWAGTTCMFR